MFQCYYSRNRRTYQKWHIATSDDCSKEEFYTLLCVALWKWTDSGLLFRKVEVVQFRGQNRVKLSDYVTLKASSTSHCDKLLSTTV